MERMNLKDVNRMLLFWFVCKNFSMIHTYSYKTKVALVRIGTYGATREPCSIYSYSKEKES